FQEPRRILLTAKDEDVFCAVARPLPRPVGRPALSEFRLWQKDPKPEMLEDFTAKMMTIAEVECRKAYNKKVYSRITQMYETRPGMRAMMKCRWENGEIAVEVCALTEIEEIRCQICEVHCPVGHGPALYHGSQPLPDGLTLQELDIPITGILNVVFVPEDQWTECIPIEVGRDFDHPYKYTDPEYWHPIVQANGWGYLPFLEFYLPTAPMRHEIEEWIPGRELPGIRKRYTKGIVRDFHPDKSNPVITKSKFPYYQAAFKVLAKEWYDFAQLIMTVESKPEATVLAFDWGYAKHRGSMHIGNTAFMTEHHRQMIMQEKNQQDLEASRFERKEMESGKIFREGFARGIALWKVARRSKFRGHIATEPARRADERDQLWRTLLTEHATLVIGLLAPTVYERARANMIMEKEKGIAVACYFASKVLRAAGLLGDVLVQDR
ncbi:MAG: hypothetical protein L6R35_007479, partial [Caloplaca aegaea]